MCLLLFWYQVVQKLSKSIVAYQIAAWAGALLPLGLNHAWVAAAATEGWTPGELQLPKKHAAPALDMMLPLKLFGEQSHV